MVVITTKKSAEDVLASLEGFTKIAIINCGTCATLCQTGGTKGLEEWEAVLKEAGKEITVGAVIEECCDNRNMMKDLRKMDEQIKDTEAILTASCGLGAQSITKILSKKYPKKPVFTASDTQFMGMTERIGRFFKRCAGCGDCLLNDTGGICPITTCAKALMNGPCGGQLKGMCEVGNYEKECGWVLIYERMKALGRLDLYSKLRPARDWSKTGHQQEVVFR